MSLKPALSKLFSKLPFQITLTLGLILCFSPVVWVLPAMGQKGPATDNGAPKYDLQAETSAQGIIDEIKMLSFGSRKDFMELIVKSGDDHLRIYVCPKPFEDEIGISFAKGDKVEIKGSKIKQEEAEVILARQLVRGTDTLMFRDEKGNPVWDWRTGK